MRRAALLCNVAAFLLGLSAPAMASSFYVEAGGGIAQVRSGDAFLGTAAPAPSAFNLALNLGIFHTFQLGDSPTEFHFGIDNRYLSGSSATDNFNVLAPYLVARFQFAIFYVEGGYATYLWRRVDPLAGYNNYQHATAYAYLGESGILWSVTPKFSMGAALNAQWVNSSGTLSPSPALSACGYMRFYFGFSGGGGDSGGGTGRAYSNEWKGWRYPFGHEVR